MKRFLMVSLVVSVFMFMVIGQVSYAAVSKEDSGLSGKVIETMDSGGYTYVCLEKSGQKTWVAVPKMKVTKGKNMSFQPGPVMTNFKSKTMNRTFDRIIFSGGSIK